MKKTISLIFIILTSTNLFSQSEYFKGKITYCPLPDNERVQQIYPLAIKCVQGNFQLDTAFKIFTEVIEISPSFCDAYFWAGYILQLKKMQEDAHFFYNTADNLSNNKSIEFKQNLAHNSELIGNITLARKKYEEIKNFFPNSPEGYYGVALTALKIGDIDYGLENINNAEKRYTSFNIDVDFVKGLLFSKNKNHKEAIIYFGKIRNDYSKNDIFNLNYALSLYELGTENNNDKMLKLAYRHFNKIINKENLEVEIKTKFETL